MWTIRLVATRILAILKILQQVSRLKTKVGKIDNCCKYPTNNQKEFTLPVSCTTKITSFCSIVQHVDKLLFCATFISLVVQLGLSFALL